MTAEGAGPRRWANGGAPLARSGAGRPARGAGGRGLPLAVRRAERGPAQAESPWCLRRRPPSGNREKDGEVAEKHKVVMRT